MKTRIYATPAVKGLISPSLTQSRGLASVYAEINNFIKHVMVALVK